MWAASCLASCCAGCACSACQGIAGAVTRRFARLAYCGLFTIALLLSWGLRDYAEPILERIPWINSFGFNPGKEWFQTQAVLRVTCGTFLFFALFSLIMINVRTRKDFRDGLHHGCWWFKLVLWAAAVIACFFLPNGAISVFSQLSRYGSGFFLLIQMVILLDFTYSWNAAWVEKDDEKWFMALLAVSIFCYVASITGIVLLFVFFNPSGYDCQLNIFFISSTLILIIAIAVVALHPKIASSCSFYSCYQIRRFSRFSNYINGSLMPAAVIGVYSTYLCYTAMSSEPRDYECNGLASHMTAVSTTTLAVGMLTTLLSVVYSAVKAGSSTAIITGTEGTPLLENGDASSDDEEASKKEKGDKPVQYVYSFFHIIFALATMYSAMLLTGWGSTQAEGTDLIDVGWPSVWVRIVSQWVTIGLYIWSLVAPLVFPDRDFS